jgi:retinol dehydrogenase-12
VKNQLWAATAEDVVNGEYYEPIGVAGKASKQSSENVDKFWEWTKRELEGHEI